MEITCNSKIKEFARFSFANLNVKGKLFDYLPCKWNCLRRSRVGWYLVGGGPGKDNSVALIGSRSRIEERSSFGRTGGGPRP